MSIVLPDGHVLETIGPFYSDGHNNDAGMTSKILKEEGYGVLDWLKSSPNQVMVVDRGFRNVIDELQSMGITAQMPSIDVKGSKQPSTESANKSRLVTKVRWVVEAYQKIKFFENRQPTAHLVVLKQCLRSTTAALNAFRPPIYDTNSDRERHQKMATKMLSLSSSNENRLSIEVASGPLSSRGKKWEEKEADEVDFLDSNLASHFQGFPRLSEEKIEEEITFGTYQLKQAQHYTDEHMEASGKFELFLHQANPGLIRGRLQSRHKSSTKYFLWVQYANNLVNGWYCQCKAGMRTLGCCAHVATIIWFLGYGRYQGYKPSKSLMKSWKKVIDADGQPDSDEESSDD